MPPLLQAPLIPQQLAPLMPMKKVLPKALSESPAVPKKLSRPAEKILPKKEDEPVREERYSNAAERMVLPASVVSSFEPLVHAPVAATESSSPPRAGIPVVPPAPAVTSLDMEKHYVKAHFVYIKKIIEDNINYPQMARRMGWQGKVVLSFVVCRDGKVEELQIVESSGYKQLDRNALETVRQVEPFPRPPVRVKLVLPVTYKIT